MNKINTKKVKELLHKKGLKNIALANYLGLPPSGICDALNGKRPLSMNYVFDLAQFFEVDALSLTVENDTANSKSSSRGKDISIPHDKGDKSA